MSSDFDINKLDKTFDSRIRLGIMSVLCVNEHIDFNSLKILLKITDGNLASHTNALEKAGYLIVIKSFVGRKPRTVYKITETGRQNFSNHLSYLEKLLKIKR